MPLTNVGEPSIWFLGAMEDVFDKIIKYAGNLALSLHHKPDVYDLRDIFNVYKEKYYNVHKVAPETLLSVPCFCATTKEQIARAEHEIDTSFLRGASEKGCLPIGPPEQVANELLKIADEFNIDEIQIYSHCRTPNEKENILLLFEYLQKHVM